jgi:hypothetical protein
MKVYIVIDARGNMNWNDSVWLDEEKANAYAKSHYEVGDYLVEEYEVI